MGRAGAGQLRPSLWRTVTSSSQLLSLQPPTMRAAILPSPAIFLTGQEEVPHSSVSVGEAKHSPRSPSQTRVLWRTPPRQEEEQEDQAPHPLHLLLRPPPQLPTLQSLPSTPSPGQASLPRPALLGTPRMTTTSVGETQERALSLLPLPHVTEQVLHEPHELQDRRAGGAKGGHCTRVAGLFMCLSS